MAICFKDSLTHSSIRTRALIRHFEGMNATALKINTNPSLQCLLTYVLFLLEKFLADNLGGLGAVLGGLLFPLNMPLRLLLEQLGVGLQGLLG